VSDRASTLLGEIHDSYVQRVNAAIASGRPELADRLAEQYPDEALRAILDHD
jgi:hypothetical protein